MGAVWNTFDSFDASHLFTYKIWFLDPCSAKKKPFYTAACFVIPTITAWYDYSTFKSGFILNPWTVLVQNCLLDTKLWKVLRFFPWRRQTILGTMYPCLQKFWNLHLCAFSMHYFKVAHLPRRPDRSFIFCSHKREACLPRRGKFFYGYNYSQ